MNFKINWNSRIFTNLKTVSFKIYKLQIITFIAPSSNKLLSRKQHLTFWLKILWCQDSLTRRSSITKSTNRLHLHCLRQCQNRSPCWWTAPAGEKLAARSDAFDWQLGPTHRRRTATTTAVPGENAIGCGNVYRGNLVGFLVLGCAPMMNRDICIPVPT